MATATESKKIIITIRLDENIVGYFKRAARDNDGSYQRMINTVLRTYVDEHGKKGAKK